MDRGGRRVNVRIFGCKKFSRLLNDREDRVLRPSELRFLDKHRAVCQGCRKEDSASVISLNMLRAAVLEVSPGIRFDERVIRRWRVQHVRESVAYWAPALVGGAIASFALFVTLHLLTVQSAPASATIPGGEAMNSVHRTSQSLELTSVPTIDR